MPGAIGTQRLLTCNDVLPQLCAVLALRGDDIESVTLGVLGQNVTKRREVLPDACEAAT